MTALTVTPVQDGRYTRPLRVSIPFGHMTREGGERLRNLLETTTGGGHGWVTRLADDAHVRRATVYAWFSGVAEPSGDTLTELSRVTGLPRWRFLAAIDGDEVLDVASPEGEERVRAIVDERLAHRAGGQ